MTPEELSVAIADVVQDHLTLSMGPVLADVKAMQVQISGWEARWNDLGLLRERVAVVEAKSAMPVGPVAVPDLSPVLERIAATEARVDVLGDLRDRVVTIETKAASVRETWAVEVPHQTDLSPVLERIAAAEARLPALEKVDVLEKDLNGLRERVAVAEMRQLIPGPTGRDGQPGRDGKDGTNGVDGLGWDDLNVSQVDERTFTVKCLRGLQVKELGTLTFPVQIYRGVYIEGKSYQHGDGVTWGGSEWHANESTNTKPGDGSKAWTLKVKRGRDGKDGKDALSMPVVSLKR